MSTAGRRLLLSATLAALGLPGAAAAHVTVTPHRLAPDAEGLLGFSAPNERERVSVRALTVTLPPGFVVGSVETKSGWEARTDGRTVTWRGGRIPPGQFDQFTLRAVAPERNGRFSVAAVEQFSDGRRETFRPRITVGPLPAAVRPGRDSGARALGKFALGVALAAALIAATAGFVALRTWLCYPEANEEAGDQAAVAVTPGRFREHRRSAGEPPPGREPR